MQKTNIFTAVRDEAPHVASCPSCSRWLWKVGPNTGFFGTAPFEKAMQYLASDGDTVQFFDEMPAPLNGYSEFDAQLLKGECPHCNAAYWFVVAAYPEVPVQNGPASSTSFICDESYIDITDQVDGAFVGDQTKAAGWVLLRQRARWQGQEIRLDVHMVGPFANGEVLAGPHGVSSCGPCSGSESRSAIWADAADLVREITPAAVAFLSGRVTRAADTSQSEVRCGETKTPSDN